MNSTRQRMCSALSVVVILGPVLVVGAAPVTTSALMCPLGTVPIPHPPTHCGPPIVL